MNSNNTRADDRPGVPGFLRVASVAIDVNCQFVDGYLEIFDGYSAA